jgi:hypothetical protein
MSCSTVTSVDTLAAGKIPKRPLRTDIRERRLKQPIGLHHAVQSQFLHHQLDELDLVRRRGRSLQELTERLHRSLAIQADQRADEQTQALALLLGLIDQGLGATGLDQHPFQFDQIGGSQGLVAPQALQRQVRLVLLQELPGLLPELAHVQASRHLRQVDRGGLAQLVLEVGVDHLLLALRDQLDQRAQAPAHGLQHRHGDVVPPLVASDGADQHDLGLDRRNRGLVFQRAGDGLDLLPQAGEVRLGLQDGKLRAQDQHVEALGLFVFVRLLRWQAGDAVAQLGMVVIAELLPHLRLDVLLDELALRPDDEVVEVHRHDSGAQQLGRLVPQLLFGRVADGVFGGPSLACVPYFWRLSSSAIISSRALNNRVVSGSLDDPSEVAGFWLKNSRFWQKSKTKKFFLSSPARTGPCTAACRAPASARTWSSTARP